MPWLKINEGDTVTASIDFSSIRSVVKHWTGQRSELCLGEGCPHCQTIPKRWRYQARLVVDGDPLSWEFGEQAMIELNAIPHDNHLARITITRVGELRGTRYQILPSPAATPSPPSYDAQEAIHSSDFLRRQYGHIFSEHD